MQHSFDVRASKIATNGARLYAVQVFCVILAHAIAEAK
jgi:hypothetical protein